jgi:hypothetical protein
MQPNRGDIYLRQGSIQARRYQVEIVISGVAKQRIPRQTKERASLSKSWIWVKQARVIPQPIQSRIEPEGPRPINKWPLKHISLKVMMATNSSSLPG